MAKVRVKAAVRKQTEERLRRIARAGSVLIDGEAFKGIPIVPELNTGDDYRVDHDKFLNVKRTLLKLKRLEDGDIGVVAWRAFKGQGEMVVPVDLHCCAVRPGNHPITPAMAEAFAGQTAVQEWELRGFPVLAVCAPIVDSMEDVVGVVEVYSSLAPEKFKVDVLG
jgi:hypothetical protein